MRKIILGLAAATTLAAPIALASSANAAVSYDGAHDGTVTGHVDKGDVQSTLRWNDAKIQNPTANPVNFSTTFSSWTDKSWQCNSGEVRHNVKTLTFKMDLTKTEVRQQSNNKIMGWDLTGMGALGALTSNTTTGYAWMNCDGAGGFSNFASMNTAQDHALGSDLLVNGVLLPETPVAVPVV